MVRSRLPARPHAEAPVPCFNARNRYVATPLMLPLPPRVKMPRTKAMDNEAINALSEAGGNWSQLAASIDRARSYTLPRAH
ncbi:unnamed protein product [Peronospora belbahrii]|uniref:HTH myb-type domain-containing protein n=1 Tax=Peronospora belbahrii TaxID=622444 RepID=A0ABN8DD95_9STRA|nr:unnamed protein product [Peronospora belbahrii]